MSINRVTLTGNLTRDIEIRYTQNNFPIGSFCLAVNDRKKNAQTDQWEDVPCFVNCTLLGKRAEGLQQYLNKGQKVGVDGKLEFSQWQTDAGEKRSTLKVLVNDLELLGGSRQQEQEQEQDAPAVTVDTDDIPF